MFLIKKRRSEQIRTVTLSNWQIQSPEALQKKAVHKILSIHKKTHVLKSLLNKVAFRKT